MSCSSNSGNNDNKDEKQILDARKKEIEEAEKLISEYLETITAGSASSSDKYLTKEALSKKNILNSDAPRIVGYKLNEIEHIGENMAADVNIYETSINKPYYGVLNMSYNIKKQGDKYLIDSISEKSSLGFFLDLEAEDKGFYVREVKTTNKEPIIKLSDIPNFMLIDTSVQPQRKVSIDRNNLNHIAISSEGKHMLFTSANKGYNVLIIAERLFQASNLTAGGDGSGDSMRKEKEASVIEISAIDIYLDSTVEYVSLSPSGDSIITKVNSKDKNTFNIYSSYSKEPICKKIIEKFNSSEYNVVDGYYYDDDKLVLKVKNNQNNQEEAYEIDTKAEKIKKIDLK